MSVSSAMLCGLLSVPAFAAVVDAAKPKDRTVSVPTGDAQAVPRQRAEQTMTKAPRTTWPQRTGAAVDLREAPTGDPLAVAPSGAVVDADSTGRAAQDAVVTVQKPTTEQRTLAGIPPQAAFAKWRKAAKEGTLSGDNRLVRAGGTPAHVDVQVLDRSEVEPVGGIGMGLRLTRDDEVEAPGPVRVTLDYSGFKYAHGGDFADRLRLVQMPACALTTPEREGCSPDLKQFVDTDNDVRSGTLSATVYADADPTAVSADDDSSPLSRSTYATATGATVLAVTSGSSSDEGDYRASTLSPSGSWDVSTGSGAFTYNLPIQLPKAPFGTTPSLALTYNSQSVDGRTSATNNQASWVGMGWDLEVGYIERRYKNCAQDGLSTIGDMCWESPNTSAEPDGAGYVINLNGVTSQLVQDGTGTGSYHLQDDPGWRVQHLWNGHGSDDEYWVISSQDGMRYYFGWGRAERNNAATNSVYTLPVVGNDTSEPCHSQYPEPCTQAWRWNLDRVVDPNEVENAYFYDKQKNHYRSVANTDKARSYDAGGYLTRIEYGWASQITGALLPAKVELTHVGRCVERMAETDPLGDEPAACPGISTNPDSYPDVPTDLMCDGTAGDSYCAGKTYYPTFFTTDMLWDIKTFVSDDGGTTWDPAMQYQTKHGLPNPDGTVGKTLWLDYVQRKGYGDGTDLRLPVINFNGEWKDNQVGSSLLNFRRVTKVYGDLGATTSVTYGQPDACDIDNLPSQSSNTQLCFWQKWEPEGSSGTKTGWFKKYLVTQVSVDPGVGQGADGDGDPTMTTRYEYNGGAGWRFTNDPLVADEDETWSDWRGYQQVEVFTGTKSNAASTYHWLYRGLDGDRTSKTDSSATRTVTVKDGQGTEYPDSAWLVGKTIETSKRDGDGSSHERTFKEYWAHVTAAYEGLPDARFVRDSKTSTHQMTSQGWRVRTVKDEYEDTSSTSTTYGLPLRTNDWGLENFDDNRCTTYGRAYSTDTFPDSDVKRWMIVEDERNHYAADCAARSSSNRDGYAVTLYDGSTSVANNDAALADGNVTEQRVYTDATHYRTTRSDYDGAGRSIAVYDGKGAKTTTTYSPTTSWPVNGVTITTPDPDGTGSATAMSTTTSYSRLWGTPYKILDANGHTTRVVHDSVGRYSTVFKPTEIANYPSGKPSIKFTYTIPTATNSDGVPDTITGPPRVTTGVLQAGSTYVNTYAYLDGLGRTRETQSTAPDGTGRTVVSTRYDTSGNVTGTSAPFYNSSGSGSGMVLPTVENLPSYNDPIMDWAGRATEVQTLANGTPQATGHTRTHYYGDYTTTVPATGERMDTFTDVFGQTTKVVEHGPRGPQSTSYQYTRSGQLKKITDAKGNATTYTYNWPGDRTATNEPDTGSSSSTYDENGQVATATDGNGRTLTYAYDTLQRPTTISNGTTTLSKLSYDSAPGGAGQPASATSYANGKAYTATITGYDDRGRVTGKRYTVPDDGSGFAGTYALGYGYDLADHMTSVSYPAVGGLPAETVTTTYSPQGLPTEVSSPLATYQSSIGFDRLGRLNARTFGASGSTDATISRAYTFNDSDGSGALSNIRTTVTAGGTTNVAQDDTFTRDLGSMLTGVTDGVTGQSECYTYDELSRLTHAWTTQATDGCTGAAASDLSSGLDPYDTTYSYDELGNLRSVKDTTTTGSTTKDYAYPGYSADGSTYTAGQARPHGVTRAGNDVFAYNNAGQMTSRTVAGVPSTLDWNDQNRVSQVTQHKSTGDTVSKYVYDANGNVLLRTSPTEDVLYLEGHELHRATGGSVTATRQYVAAGTPVAMRGANGMTWLLGDNQASTSLLVAVDGTVARRRYTPFGAQRGSTGLPSSTDRGFLGKPEDDSTGLSILGARMYDASLGRFLSPDELNKPYSPQEMNAYSYAINNPIAFSDPSGLEISVPGKGSQPYTCKSNLDYCPKKVQNAVGYNPDTKTVGYDPVTGSGAPPAKVLKEFFGKVKVPSISQMVGWGSYRENLPLSLNIELYFRDRCLDGLQGMSSCMAMAEYYDNWSAVSEIPINPCEASSLCQSLGDLAAGMMARGMKGSPCSFDPQTPVLMADGKTKPIGKVAPGDHVESGDPDDGKHVGPRKVTARFVHRDDDLVDLTIRGTDGHDSVLHTTSDHPFWNDTTHSWVKAADLRPGHVLNTDTDNHVRIVAVEDRPGSAGMYNLTVEQLHTYYVLAGETPVLVHNSNCSIGSVTGPAGEVLPLPKGAAGTPVATGKGWAYDIPTGTKGLDPRVVQVRVMDPVTTGKYQYPNGYVVYMNKAGQSVNPLTGQTVGKADPYNHIPIP
ncbi:RHS repeat-associated core domain-containing protein [Streptomyces sp. NPDC012510]|uniref:RHS repeat-associated core domain-containing protein n=1 Tax=Streptomyces sp. NPDC012510 TaxID=3364838 RepID=UPI0036EBB9B9